MLRIEKKTWTKANKALDKIAKTYHKGIPFGDISDALQAFGIIPLQEDGTAFSGLFCGREGRATINIGPAVNRPFDNAYLILAWYKLESGNYEIVAYIS